LQLERVLKKELGEKEWEKRDLPPFGGSGTGLGSLLICRDCTAEVRLAPSFGGRL